MSDKSSFKFKDRDGLRLVRGVLPPDQAGDILMTWAKEGYTEADGALNAVFKCDYVTGSKESIAAARVKYGLDKA